jgi:hypothetical protein
MVMRRTQAWERMNDPHHVGLLDTVGLYNLALEAGYSKDVAQRIASKRGWQRLDAGVAM